MIKKNLPVALKLGSMTPSNPATFKFLWLHASLELCDGMSIGPVLCRPYTGSHCCCEFMAAMAGSILPGWLAFIVPCLENSMSQHPSLSPGSYVLSISSSTVFLGGSDIVVLFMVKHSTVTYSLHQLQTKTSLAISESGINTATQFGTIFIKQNNNRRFLS